MENAWFFHCPFGGGAPFSFSAAACRQGNPDADGLERLVPLGSCILGAVPGSACASASVNRVHGSIAWMAALVAVSPGCLGAVSSGFTTAAPLSAAPPHPARAVTMSKIASVRTVLMPTTCIPSSLLPGQCARFLPGTLPDHESQMSAPVRKNGAWRPITHVRRTR